MVWFATAARQVASGFGAVAIVATFAFPVVFSGTPIYDPKLGIDDGLFIRPPLRLGLSNAAQAVFVVLHIATAYAVLRIRFSATLTRRIYIFAFYLSLVFIFAQSFCSLTGLPYPDSVFRNNPGYGIVDLSLIYRGVRCPGTFTEPSIAGRLYRDVLCRVPCGVSRWQRRRF